MMAAWSPQANVAALRFVKGYAQAQGLRALLDGSIKIFQEEVAAIRLASPGISPKLLGTLAGSSAKTRILQLAEKLGIQAIGEAKMLVPKSVREISHSGKTIVFRKADLYIPKHRLVLELTTEASQDVMKLTLHKQGQLADYLLAKRRVIIINHKP